MKKLILASCMLYMFQAAFATDYSAYVGELGGLGSGVTQNIKQPQNYTPRYTDNPPMAEQYYGGGISIPTQYGESKIAGCKNNTANPDLYLRQECEGVNFIANNKTKKPDVTVSANEKLVTGTQSIAGDPAETLDKYQWKYPVNADGSIGTVPSTACPTETVQIPAVVTTKTCSEYKGAELFLCEAVLKVKVDPNWNYSCLETKFNNEKHTCSQKLRVVCERRPDCATSGIRLTNLQGDMQIRFTKDSGANTYTLTFGSIGDNYFSTGLYDREMIVDLKDYKNLGMFTLKRVEYDDWLVVKVNDTIVYSSYKNKMLTAGDFEKMGWRKRLTPVFADGKRVGIAERQTSWKKDLDIDLRPYLKEGVNKIWTRTIVGGGGEVALMFQAQQYCDAVCKDTWVNECASLEMRAK